MKCVDCGAANLDDDHTYEQCVRNLVEKVAIYTDALHRVLMSVGHLRADSGDFEDGELIEYAEGFVADRTPKGKIK